VSKGGIPTRPSLIPEREGEFYAMKLLNNKHPIISPTTVKLKLQHLSSVLEFSINLLYHI